MEFNDKTPRRRGFNLFDDITSIKCTVSAVDKKKEASRQGASSTDSSEVDVSLPVTQAVPPRSNVTEASSPVSSVFGTAPRFTGPPPLTGANKVYVGDNRNPAADDRVLPPQKSVVRVAASPARNSIHEAPPRNNVTDRAPPTPVSSVFGSAPRFTGPPLTGANKIYVGDRMAATEDRAPPSSSLPTQKPVKVITNPALNSSEDNFSFVNASNVCDIILAAYKHNYSALKEKCVEIIIANKEAIGRERISTLPSSVLCDIIFGLL